jgi:hypothetical protein
MMKRIALMICLALLIINSGSMIRMETTNAQQKTEAMADGPAASPSDVSSIDAIIAAAYDTISGPAGKKRDWDRLRSLFAPGARLIPTGARPDGVYEAHVTDVEGYIKRAGDYFDKNGFFEREAARRMDQYGNIAQVFSTYESRHKAEDAKPFARGINSFQLIYDGKRWWIVTIYWQQESPENPIPKKYLKSSKD